MNDLYELDLEEEAGRGPRRGARPAASARAAAGPGARPPAAALSAAGQGAMHDRRFVRWVQGALNRSRGLRLPLDGQLGAATRSALRNLLDAPADAAVDAGSDTGTDIAVDSAGASESEWQGEISRASRDYIMWLQSSLNRLLGLNLAVDGISGTMTRAAVRDFQTRQRLGVDGIVGPITEAALIAAGATAPPGSTAAPAPAAPTAPGPAARWTVPESALTSLLPSVARYTYDLANPRYPSSLPGVSLPLAPPEQTNCCCFAEWFIVKAFAGQHGSAFQWSSQRHAQMMIPADFSDRYAPVTAMVEAGMATAVPDGAAPSAWCLFQGWRTGTSGHTMIIVAYHAPSDRVLTLEANSAYGLNGVGCRNFGNLRDLAGGRSPARWWEDARAPTWSSLRSAYGYGSKMAKLGVSGRSWAGLPA
jgi:peptidoglycan hydrolase-like protein with peptidoglycan-binding domain